MGKQRELRLIDGNYAKSGNVIARCNFHAHRGFLTTALVKSHCCVEKKCPLLEKTDLKYWYVLENVEKTKKSTRKKRKEQQKKVINRDAFIRETLERNGHIHVTSIREEGRLFIVSYIYDKRVDLAPEIELLRDKLKRPIKLTARIGPSEAIEKLIRKPRRETQKVTDVRKAPKVGNATKMRFAALGIHCLEDLFGRNGDELYRLDCELSGKHVNRRYLTAYKSAVSFANEML